jgi:hypothetical protein
LWVCLLKEMSLKEQFNCWRIVFYFVGGPTESDPNLIWCTSSRHVNATISQHLVHDTDMINSGIARYSVECIRRQSLCDNRVNRQRKLGSTLSTGKPPAEQPGYGRGSNKLTSVRNNLLSKQLKVDYHFWHLGRWNNGNKLIEDKLIFTWHRAYPIQYHNKAQNTSKLKAGLHIQ